MNLAGRTLDQSLLSVPVHFQNLCDPPSLKLKYSVSRAMLGVTKVVKVLTNFLILQAFFQIKYDRRIFYALLWHRYSILEFLT